MTPTSFDTVWNIPWLAAQQLSVLDDVGRVTIDVDSVDRHLRVFRATFEPIASALHGYPREQIQLVVRRDKKVYAVPVGADGRRWLHRYPRVPLRSLHEEIAAGDWHRLLGALCLEYPEDPVSRRWAWDKGFEVFVAGVRQHVLNEECWRREGQWPIEDAPHRPRADGRPHPFRSRDLRP